jgi:DNA-binding response OmpR family regulator
MGVISGKRILIVEDNFLIAEIISDTVQSKGGFPIGPFHQVDHVLEYLHEGGLVDVAILDWHLDRTSIDIASLLKVKAVPTIFVTGFAADLPSEFRDEVICCKPFTAASLTIALSAALAGPAIEARRSA